MNDTTMVGAAMQTVDDLARIIGRQHTTCPAVRRAAAQCSAGWRLVDAVPPFVAQMRHKHGDYPANAKGVMLAHSKFGYAGLMGVFIPSVSDPSGDAATVQG